MADGQSDLIEQFKSGLDPAGAAAMAERMTGAEARVAALEAELAAAQASQEVPGSEPQVKLLQGQLDDATARAETAEAALTKAQDRFAAKLKRVASGEPSAKPRPLAPMAEGKALERDALRAAIEDAGKAEIVFSDGKREIAGLPPVIVSGDVWKDHPLGLMLTEPVDLHGPAIGRGGYAIEGYALVLDGKPVAFTTRDPLTVSGGQHVRLADDIYF